MPADDWCEIAIDGEVVPFHDIAGSACNREPAMQCCLSRGPMVLFAYLKGRGGHGGSLEEKCELKPANQARLSESSRFNKPPKFMPALKRKQFTFHDLRLVTRLVTLLFC